MISKRRPRLPIAKSEVQAYPKPKDRPRAKLGAYKIHLNGREVCYNTAAGKREYRLRTIKMVNRQKGICPKCCKSMSLFDFSFQHGNTRGMGGSTGGGAFRDDRIDSPGNCAMHVRCNGELGSRRFHA